MAARILVIDDNPANLYLMTYLLQAEGHEVLMATNGIEGLAMVRRHAADLVICDAQMPLMDGYEFARAVRADRELRSLMLVSVTANAMIGDREKSLAAGFDDYISKPIVPETFARQIAELVRRGASERGQNTDC